MSIEENQKNTTAPLISVVLPVYNGEKDIAEAVESILCQTLDDFELIVIDDGSTDKTLIILQEYQDPRIRLISRENRGLIATLNEGIDAACGEWVARMDADDIALPNRFERQLEWVEITKADICGSWVKRFGEKDQRIVRLRETDQEIKTEMLFCSPFAHPSVIIRSSVLRHLRYDAKCEKAEDYDLWVRAAESGLTMTNIPEVLLLYRVHKEQVSSEHGCLQQKKAQEIRHRYWSSFLYSSNLSSERLKSALNIFIAPRLDIDMDAAETVFYGLMRNNENISKATAFSHIKRLYILAAADCPDIIARWYKLNREFGMKSSGMATMKLMLFHVLRIRENDSIYNLIKKLYLWKNRILSG